MKYRLLFGSFGLVLSLVFQSVQAQIQITYPLNRIIYQRSASNTATITVGGTYTQPVDRVEARFVPVLGGIATGWKLLQANPLGGSFQGNLTVSAGWYSLEVRGYIGESTVGSATLERIGVGEVFLIMGHSNAQGGATPSKGATDERVISADFSKLDFSAYNQTADPNFLSGLDFTPLCQSCGIAPYGGVPWVWSQLGDLLVKKLNVPVLFYSAAFGGTSMEQNYKIIKNIPFEGGFVNSRIGMPYINLKNALIRYVPTTGLRAVLAVHGENDRFSSKEDIVKFYQTTIEQSRIDAGKPDLPWVVAISSFNSKTWDNVTSAQREVIATTPNVAEGPNLDLVNSVEDRPDRLHYSEIGQPKIAALWNEALTGAFFQNSALKLPIAPPVATPFCADGTNLTLTLPNGFVSYGWSNGTRTASTTPGPGTYSATVRDAKGNYWFTPTFLVPTNPGPPQPRITPLSKTTFCQETGVTLTASGNTQDTTYRWSTGLTSSRLTTNQSGDFSVRAYNRIGCFSQPATVLRTTAAPIPAAPNVERTGPFTLKATPSGQAVNYDWQVDNGALVTSQVELFKTSVDATYRTRSNNALTLNAEPLVCRSAWSLPVAVNLSEFGSEQFIVYPSPSVDGRVTLDSRQVWQNLEVSVVGADGRELFRRSYPQFTSRLELNLGRVPGLYYVRVQGGDLRDVQKVLVR